MSQDKSDVDRYYKILHLKPDASPEEIKQAYWECAHLVHPDKHANNERLRQRAEEMMKDINEAYEQLMSFQSDFRTKAAQAKHHSQETEPHWTPTDNQSDNRQPSSESPPHTGDSQSESQFRKSDPRPETGGSQSKIYQTSDETTFSTGKSHIFSPVSQNTDLKWVLGFTVFSIMTVGIGLKRVTDAITYFIDRLNLPNGIAEICAGVLIIFPFLSYVCFWLLPIVLVGHAIGSLVKKEWGSFVITVIAASIGFCIWYFRIYAHYVP